MKTKILIILILLSLIGCRKKLIKEDISDSTENEINFLFKQIEKDSIDISAKIKANDRIFNFLENKNYSKLLPSLEKVTENYYKFYELEKQKKSSFLLLDTAIEKNDSSYIANAYNYIGKYYYDVLKKDSSFYYFSKAERLYLKSNDTILLAEVYLQKSKIQIDENNFISGLNKSLLALKFLKNTKRFKELFNCYILLGDASDELSEHQNSIYYYNEALKVIDEDDGKLLNKSLHLKSSVYNNIGYVYKNIKDYEKAIQYFKKALDDKNLKFDSPRFYAMALDNLAYSKLKLKQLDNLPNLFVESLTIREKNNISTGIILNKIHLSEYYQAINDSANSRKYALEALNQAKKQRLVGDILLSLKQAAIVDKKSAYLYSDDYIRINDSLQLVERNSKDRFARIELETDELKRENVILEERNREFLNYLFITILFAGFMYYMRVQRSKGRELALKQAHQKANEEIYRLIISHQNQLEEGRDLEKKRLSKELHDGVLGRLFGLRLNLDGLNSFDDTEAKQQRLDYLNELKVIEQDLREISHELSRENLVLINNFVAILNRLVEEQAKVNSAKIKMIIADDIQWDKVSNIVKINLYRILQEALQNINKHAKANNILVHFRSDKKGNLLFDIEDDGIGYDTTDKKKKGIGTKNIVERTQQCNGFIDIKSEVGVGSKIIITFPIDSKTIKI